MRLRIHVKTRLMEKIRIPDGGGCWEWIGGKQNGYGTIHYDGGNEPAHRAMWRVCVSEIPAGMFVCHHCDNRRCVRPDHLFLGTQADNMRDMAEKGRSTHKLSTEDILAIRSMGGSPSAIAAGFGISGGQVSRIRLRQSWKHVAQEGAIQLKTSKPKPSLCPTCGRFVGKYEVYCNQHLLPPQVPRASNDEIKWRALK